MRTVVSCHWSGIPVVIVWTQLVAVWGVLERKASKYSNIFETEEKAETSHCKNKFSWWQIILLVISSNTYRSGICTIN